MGQVVCGWWRGGGDAFLWGWKLSFFFVSYAVVSFILCKFAFDYCKIVLLWLSLKPM